MPQALQKLFPGNISKFPAFDYARAFNQSNERNHKMRYMQGANSFENFV